MSVFGWCTTGHHKSCRFEIGGGAGIMVCECDCHVDNSPIPQGETVKIGPQLNGPERGVRTSGRGLADADRSAN